MSITQHFATSLYSDSLLKSGNSRFANELLKQCKIIRATDDAGRAWSKENYPHGYTSYGSLSEIHRYFPPFEELAGKINRHVRKLARHLEMDLQGGRLEMSSCWVNIMPTWTAHPRHLHPLGVISGTYYVSVPRASSHIKFEDPRLAQFMASPPKLASARARNQRFTSLNPKVGQVVLWESWLRHEVPANRARSERVSVSFNFEWR